MSEPSEREELARLAAGLRVHAEWLASTGATGVPAAVRAPANARRAAIDKRAPGAVAEGAPARREAAPYAHESPNAAADPSAAAGFQATTVVGAAEAAPASASATALPAGSAKLRLIELAEEIKGCQKCPLHAGREQTVFARGNPSAELCFVGEGPGADEDEQGFPFVGAAGQLLDRMVVAMGFSRDDVYVCNIVKCRPPQNRKPEPNEMASCNPYLREQLELVAPKVIVALGATAVEGLIGASGGITRMRGQWKVYRATPVMPTFHPAYLLRNPAAKREVWADLQAVLKQLGRPLPPAGRSA